MNILVTGGAGYIGSHTAVELIKQNHSVVIVDNFSNSSPEAVKRLQEITGKTIPFYEGDVRDKKLLRKIFDEHIVDAAIHFAGLKAVDKSVREPLNYYRNNIDSSLSLCEVMQEKGVKKLIFSSSATVYGDPAELPLKETSSTGKGITNPYGQTKYMIEQILSDVVMADREWAITALRYFNPIGAHASGRIGEDPNDIPNNLTPYIAQVAVGRLKKLHVFGNDYDTPDGTGVRDYIHVVDLAKGHVAALEHMKPSGKLEIYNLGTGKGISVFEMVKAFEKACGKRIPYIVDARRPGDVASCYADAIKAARELGWRTEKTLEQACADSWRWQSQNPNGYKT
ncbi:MAG TPA: UDP-glucose 4-epimerase GalE [Candidatus Saccharimonadales bacterium]|nr:UDP-glucose 4-epimerase GalE [Candidatus Saccharimonadales bacterium]